MTPAGPDRLYKGKSMTKWKLIAGVALLFASGLLVGTLASAIYIKHKHPLFKRDPELKTRYIMEKLSGKLDLIGPQKEKITEIVQGIETEARNLYQRHRKEMKAVLEKGVTEMKKELNPEQIRELDQMREEYRKRKEKRRKR